MKKTTQFHIRPARPDEAGLFYAQHPEEDKRLGAVGPVSYTHLYSDTTDHYVGGKGFRPVSEDEANAVREKYTHDTLSFTPFVV